MGQMSQLLIPREPAPAPPGYRDCIAGGPPREPDVILPVARHDVRDCVRGLGIVAVISGGQTGVDRAAIDVASGYGIPIGGWAPRGWAAEDGVVPVRYRTVLRECPDRGEPYAARTRRNVLASDLVLVVVPLEGGGPGTRLTERLAEEHGRPLLRIPLGADRQARAEIQQRGITVRWWLRTNARPGGTVLMVAGPRASRWAHGVEVTERLLAAVLDPRGRA